MYLTTRRLYTTADDRLCEGHDPDVLYLLAPAGVMLPEATAQRYKLREADAAREAGSTSETETDEEPAADTDETDAADSEPETDDESTDAEAKAEAAPKQSNRKSRTAAS